MITYIVQFTNNSKNRHWSYTGVTHIDHNRTGVTIRGIEPVTMECYSCRLSREEFDIYEVSKED